MTPSEFDSIQRLEAELWSAADNLRANSKLTSSEYCMPVLGVIFLRHATTRYENALAEIQAAKASGEIPKRPLVRADFIKRRALMLPEEARYDHLLALPKSENLGSALIAAMEAIERDFEPLAGQLPKDYGKFEPGVLESLLRTFDSQALRDSSGDVFGRIYEYFLMKFAMQGAQDNGEFFTPPSIVQLIVNVIEPDHGIIADLACGSGGMFVQSSHFIEDKGGRTMARATFYGQEKTATTIRLAKMNLAVHGLEGDILEANTFYDDPHRLADGRPLWGNCDFIMANPPFNVDMVDAGMIEKDRRLPFGLPGVNKAGKVSNGNYLWASYFHSYLGEKGRAGFVMSSQASSAGHGEAEVRRKLVETGDVDVMIAIRPNFFYTRTVPCEIWCYDRGKPKAKKDSVLMLDARHVFRKVTRKIFDFSPEQQKNLSAVVWLYRGERLRFAELCAAYRMECIMAAGQLDHAKHVFQSDSEAHQEIGLKDHLSKFKAVLSNPGDDLKSPPAAEDVREYGEKADEMETRRQELIRASDAMRDYLESHRPSLDDGSDPARDLQAAIGRYTCNLPRMEDGAKQMAAYRDTALAYGKSVREIVAFASAKFGAHRLSFWKKDWRIPELVGELEETLAEISKHVEHYAYFRKQLHWLLHRFPDGVFTDVPGLCKAVSREEIAAADWSLTPGRYVGVAPEEVDEDFDFPQAMKDIHTELAELDQEAGELAKRIQENFAELGV